MCLHLHCLRRPLALCPTLCDVSHLLLGFMHRLITTVSCAFCHTTCCSCSHFPGTCQNDQAAPIGLQAYSGTSRKCTSSSVGTLTIGRATPSNTTFSSTSASKALMAATGILTACVPRSYWLPYSMNTTYVDIQDCVSLHCFCNTSVLQPLSGLASGGRDMHNPVCSCSWTDTEGGAKAQSTRDADYCPHAGDALSV